MPKFTIRKFLELEVVIDAATPQQAFEQQLEMDDNSFVVIECDYEVYDDNDNNLSQAVTIP